MSTTGTSAAPGALRSTSLRTWREPSTASAARGTVVVLVGRGETAEVYERFGRRLAADGYRVVAVGQCRPAPQALAQLLAPLPAPHVVVGSDAGALTAVRVARAGHVDAVVLAGLPTSAGVHGLSWHAELDARTACAAHQQVLAQATRTSMFADASAIAAADLTRPDDAPLGVPLLAVHGAADRISPAEQAVAAYRTLGARQVALVTDGRHDVLNDAAHRTVAATIVQFLERVRLGADLPEIVRDVAAQPLPTTPAVGSGPPSPSAVTGTALAGARPLAAHP